MQAVIFDLGRVLIEYDQQYMLEALASVSQLPAGEIRKILGTVAIQLDIGQLGASDFHQLMIREAGAIEAYPLFERAFCSSIARNESALAYAFGLQQRGFKVGVISNTNQGHTGYLRTLLPELTRFDDVVFSNEVGLRKPSPEIYLHSLQRLAVPAQQAVFVDDILDNVEGARAVGIWGIHHVDWPQTGEQLEHLLANA